jgi:hypothetical protein
MRQILPWWSRLKNAEPMWSDSHSRRCTRYGIASPPICSSRTSTYAKLDTTARYTRVDTNIIREIMSPPDRLTPLVPRKTDPPPA